MERFAPNGDTNKARCLTILRLVVVGASKTIVLAEYVFSTDYGKKVRASVSARYILQHSATAINEVSSDSSHLENVPLTFDWFHTPTPRCPRQVAKFRSFHSRGWQIAAEFWVRSSEKNS